MEFFVTLAVLYAAQCLRKLEADEVLVLHGRCPGRRAAGRTWVFRGPGWRCLHPWPAVLVASARDGIPLERRPADPSGLAGDLEAALRGTRALRWLSSLQLVWILLLGPIAAATIGAEATLLLGSGPALGFHLIGVALLHRAQRTLLPDDPKAAERLSIAALYPPALLRSGAEIIRCSLADRPFAELAAVLFDDRRFEAFIRSGIGRAKSARRRMDGDPPEDARREIDWLLELAAMRSLDRARILSPRPRTDPSAESYCEACGSDFVAGYRFCGECRLETTFYR